MHTVERLGVACEQYLFVGDEPEWDIKGSAAVGMRPVLMDRGDYYPDHKGEQIRDLNGLLELL